VHRVISVAAADFSTVSTVSGDIVVWANDVKLRRRRPCWHHRRGHRLEQGIDVQPLQAESWHSWSSGAHV